MLILNTNVRCQKIFETWVWGLITYLGHLIVFYTYFFPCLRVIFLFFFPKKLYPINKNKNLSEDYEREQFGECTCMGRCPSTPIELNITKNALKLPQPQIFLGNCHWTLPYYHACVHYKITTHIFTPNITPPPLKFLVCANDATNRYSL